MSGEWVSAETLRNALLLLADTGEPLTQLEALLYDRSFRASCIDRSGAESVTGFWQRYGDLSDEKQRALAMQWDQQGEFAASPPTPSAANPWAYLAHRPSRHLNTKGSILLVSLSVEQSCTDPAA